MVRGVCLCEVCVLWSVCELGLCVCGARVLCCVLVKCVWCVMFVNEWSVGCMWFVCVV